MNVYLFAAVILLLPRVGVVAPKAFNTSVDFGIGSDEYKRTFCKDDEPVFDSFIPLTARGRLTAFGLSSLAKPAAKITLRWLPLES